MELKATIYEKGDDGVAVVTLNRPDRLNAWTTRMENEYRWCLGEADGDPGVRVIVITGAGRGFCAGADTEALGGIKATGKYGTGQSEPVPLPGRGAGPDFEHAFPFPLALKKPVIAAVNGPAAGVGFVLMCFCDIRFAAAGAKLTTSFGRLGLPAEHGVSWLLARQIGVGRAADMLFSSRVVLAEEALELGLVNRVCDPPSLLKETMEYARAMAAEISPASLQAMKRQLYTDLLGSLDASASDAEERMRQSFTSADFAEGVAALTEKRPPRFGPLS